MKIAVDQDLYQDILNEVKQWPLNKPGRVNWTQFNNVILASSAKCPWLHGRIPSEHAQAERYREAFESAGLTLDEFKANN
jgi:hypothetical protein